MQTKEQSIVRQSLRLVLYLLVSLTFGIIVTLVLDSYENIAIEKDIRKEEETEVRNAARAFKESSPHATPDQVIGFIERFVSTGMGDKLIVVDPGRGGVPNLKESHFLVSLVEGEHRVDIYIRSSFLRSELASLDVPELISGMFVTIGVFTFLVLYTEKKRQTLAMKQRFESQHAEFTMALKEREALALLGRMVSTLAHELKTPISTISNLIQVFPARCWDETFTRRFVTLTREELNRTQQLIDNLLVYGKEIDAKNEEWIAFDSFIKGLAEKDGIRISACPTFRVYGDRFYLGLLFENLLRNSRVADADEVSIKVLSPSLEDDSFGEILFEDNGSGFPEESDLDELLNPFVTGRSSGAGLGLYLAKKIAMAHNGVIIPYRLKRGAGIKISFQKKRMKNG